ncbi:hypothetical protein ACLMJK_009733 [Lecanora helva]
MYVKTLLPLSALLGGLTFGDSSKSQYEVWPKDATDQKSNVVTSSQLRNWTDNGNPIIISQAGIDLSSVNYWSTYLTEDQACQLKSLDTVAAVVTPCDSNCREFEDFFRAPNRTSLDLIATRTRSNISATVTQYESPPELVMVSQPPWGKPSDEYAYDSSAGDGATVYLFDTVSVCERQDLVKYNLIVDACKGAYSLDPVCRKFVRTYNMILDFAESKQEFVDLRHKWEWAGPNYRKRPNGTYLDPLIRGDWPLGHGIGVLSKIGGKTLGVAKNVQAVIVRRPLDFHTQDLIDTLTWIIDDWRSRRTRISIKAAIINMAFGWTHRRGKDPMAIARLTRIQNLLNLAIE